MIFYYIIRSIVYLYYIYIITPNIVFCWFLLTRPSQSPRTRCFPTRPGRSLRRTPLNRWYNRWYILVLMESWWTCLKLERTAGNHTRLLNFLQNFHGHCWCITVFLWKRWIRDFRAKIGHEKKQLGKGSLRFQASCGYFFPWCVGAQALTVLMMVRYAASSLNLKEVFE